MRSGLPGTPRSLWMDPPRDLALPGLSDDLEADVCVLGAGITGLTAALELQEAGRSVVVLDMHRVGAGVTSHSTAKLSSLQGTTYTQLERRFGRRGAAGYAAMNEAAIDAIAQRIERYDIACDFRRRPHALFAWNADEAAQLEQEAQAARRAGLAVELTVDLGLPFPIAGGLVRRGQAELQIRDYALGLAEALLAAGGRIFERTTATAVGLGLPGRRPEVRAVPAAGGGSDASGNGGGDAQHRVRARDVLVATHYPFLDRGLYFPRLTPTRSYAIAVRGAQPVPDLMAISIGQPTRSLRAAPDPDRPGEELLVLGGEGHPAGEQGDRTDDRYRALAAFAARWHGSDAVTHRWSAHDMTSADGLPYAGPLTPAEPHVWVASGYRKWGLTNGTACGLVIAERILGGRAADDTFARFASVVDTNRLTPLRSAPGVLKEGIKDGLHFAGDRLRVPDPRSLEALEPGGDGYLLEVDGDVIAASRDDDGTTHVLSPTCTHLGCRVAWNRAERTWDCPCHGSRFAPNGTVLEGPAVAPLHRRDRAAAASKT